VDKIAREGVKLALICTGIPVALIYLLHRPILGLFLPAGSPSIDIAVTINNHVLWGFILFSLTFAFTGVVRATGAVLAPLLILVVTMWLVRVPLAAWASAHYGAVAIWWSFPISSTASASLAFLYYRYGGWRKARLIDRPAPPAAIVSDP
jgi:Na+-driven multidrug efflux pump